MPGEIALRLEKYLLRGSFLAKLQASSIVSKKVTKILHEWSLVINLFRWLTIQTTFKIDSIPCNCVCIFKTFSKQYCLDYYIKRKKCSSFTETYRVFRGCRKRVLQHISATIMNGWNGKNVLSLVKRIHSVRGNTVLAFYLFVWASCKWKKQYYTFNNSSILQMLGKNHCCF